MPESTGWLLDLFEHREEGVIFYFITKKGRRLRLHQNFPITFYALGENAQLRKLWRFLEAQPCHPKLKRDVRSDVFSRRDETVLAIETANVHVHRALFQKVLQTFPDLSYADVDIQLSIRFSAATGVFPMGLCKLHYDENFTLLNILPLEDAWSVNDKIIPLRIMSITPNHNPAHANPSQLLIEIDGRTCQLNLQPERALLTNLRAMILRYDPDLLLTDWGDTWLLPWLMEAAQRHHIDLLLNREPGQQIRWQKERSFFSYGQIVYRGQQIHLFGRCHIDRRNAGFWKDCQLDGMLEACRMTSLPLQISARTSPGTGISSIEMLTALRDGILVPWQKQQAELVKPASELFLADQGGLVYQPQVGVHNHVAEIDFVSLYPAIMVNFNISPETILTNPSGEDMVPSLGIGIDQTKPGIVARALKPLLLKRITLKTSLGKLPVWNPLHASLSYRASALKWLLVTCFGYLGYKNARFGRIEAHQAVTAYGREILLRAKEAAEEAGFEVLHLYVDALWVCKEGCTEPADFEDLLVNIHHRTDIPIALDGVYRWVVFLPSRQNVNRPVPNRYFGVFQDGSLKMRGIDARRHDTTPFIGATQKHILEMLTEQNQPRDALPEILRYLKFRLRKLRNGNVPLKELIVKRRLGRELDAYRTLPAAGRAARQLEAIGKHLRPGQRVEFIHMLGKPGVHAWDLPELPNPDAIDWDYYQKLLVRAASTVLQPWVGSEEALKELLFSNGVQLALPKMKARHPVKHSAEISVNGPVMLQQMDCHLLAG